MRRRYAPRKWCLCDYSHAPCRPQVRGRSELLARTPVSTFNGCEAGDRLMTETSGQYQDAGLTSRNGVTLSYLISAGTYSGPVGESINVSL